MVCLRVALREMARRRKRSTEYCLCLVLGSADKGIHYRALYPPEPPYTAYVADLESDTTKSLLVSYFQLDTPLAPLYAEWAAKDPHFRKKIEHEGERLEGIRVLNQDPWETLVS